MHVSAGWKTGKTAFPLSAFSSRKEETWLIDIHERVFDFVAFVIPSDPDAKLGSHVPGKKGKVLSFIEFVLRHQVEHMLYPKESEREVIRSDLGICHGPA